MDQARGGWMARMVAWARMVAIGGALVVLVGGAIGGSAEAASATRGIATFVHGAERASPGSPLALVVVVYGFDTLTEAAPLPGAHVQLAWDPSHTGAEDLVALTGHVDADTDQDGAAQLRIDAPHGAGPWTLLVHARFGDKERTDAVIIQRSDVESVRLSRSTARARAGDTVHAWVEITRGMQPAAGTRVRFDVLEGDVAVTSVWSKTDAAGHADTELRLPKSDAQLTGWTLSATTEQGAHDHAELPQEEDTPTEARIEYQPNDTSPAPGGPLIVVGQLLDATNDPVRNTDIVTWSGPEGAAVDLDSETGKTLAQTTKTDDKGWFRVQSTMPALVGRAGLTWLTRAAAIVRGERVLADHQTTVGRSARQVRLVQPADGVIPGLREELLLVADDEHLAPLPHLEFRVEGDGLTQALRTNERGEALILWNVPAQIGSTRRVEPCAGGVAANLAILAEPSAIAAGFPARMDRCVPVHREAHAKVRIERPIVREGEVATLRVQDTRQISGGTYSILARGERAVRTAVARAGVTTIATNGLPPGPYTITAIAVDRAARTDHTAHADHADHADRRASALGSFLLVPARMPRPTVTLRSRDHLPYGHASIEMKLLDDAGRPFAGMVSAIVTERRFDAQKAALALDVRRSYCANDGHHALRCDDQVNESSPRQTSARAYLAEQAQVPLAAHLNPMHDAYKSAEATFSTVVRSLEGAVFEASGSRDTLQDVLRRVGGHNHFNPELLTLAVQALPTPPRTPGGQPVTLADLSSLDAQVDYDHVARRVARYKLFKLLEALRNARLDKDPSDVSFDDPNAALRRLLAAQTIDESELLDPWGGTMAFVKSAGTTPDFLSPKNGYALHAPGPDGRLGSADDVSSPFERVLRSNTPYALATHEDKVVDARFDLQIAQSSVDAWGEILRAATGRTLGEQEEQEGHAAPGLRLRGGGHGGGTSVGRGYARVDNGSGFRALVAPHVVAADGSVQLEVPLGGGEGIYRVLLIGDVPGLGRVVEFVDVPVVLKRSLRVRTADRWVVGDAGELDVVVENRDDAAASLEVVAEASAGVAFDETRPTQLSVPAHAARTLTLHVRAPQVGNARVRVALYERGQLLDRYERSWSVTPAGEPILLANAAWVRAKTRIPRPHAAGHLARGAQMLSVQANGNEVLRAALQSVEPSRLREQRQAEDALRLARAVHHYAEAHGDKLFAAEADAIAARARGRASILPARNASDDGRPTPRDGCKAIAPERLFREDPAGLGEDASKRVQNTEHCFDQQINQRVDELLTKGDATEIARAILELAERAPRESLLIALALALHERVKLTQDGRMTSSERPDRVGRVLLLAALLRSAASVASLRAVRAEALLPWLLVEQDAYGSFGSVEATSAAVRAIVASAAMVDYRPTTIEVETSNGTQTLAVPRTGVVQYRLPDDDEPVAISVHGTPVLARVLSHTLRSFQHPPLPAANSAEVRIDWPDGRAEQGPLRLSLRVAPHGSGAPTELRVPLPANLELAQKPPGDARVIDHVLRMWIPKTGVALQLLLRPQHRGRFTAPEGGLYVGGERVRVVPASVVVTR